MSKRFKLVFLCENEEYITDIGCTVDTRRLGGVVPDSDLSNSILSRFVKSGGFKGRFRIGSKSIYLDLESVVCTSKHFPIQCETRMISYGYRLSRSPAFG